MSDFLKNTIIGIIILGVVGSIIANYIWDIFPNSFKFTGKVNQQNIDKRSDGKQVVYKIESNRPRIVGGENYLSDFLVLSKNGQNIASYEFYHEGKSSSLYEYPGVAHAFERKAATAIHVEDVDFGGQNGKMLLLLLSHREMFTHPDQLIDFLIVDYEGKILASAPSPDKENFLGIKRVSPYSAFDKVAILYDKISGNRQPINFVNKVDVQNDKRICFGWRVDNDCYACPAVFQEENYKVEDRKLVKVSGPEWYLCEGDNRREMPVDEVRNYIIEHDQGSFDDIVNSIENNMKEKHNGKSEK